MRTHKLWTLLLTMLCLLSLSATAFAKVEETGSGVIETWAQIAEPPSAAPDKTDAPQEKPVSDDADGEDGFYTRDLLYDAATHKQFITVQGRDGNIFYIVIDYDVAVGDGEEQYKVYFLNQVDERDLAALVEDTGTAAPPVCTCTEKCAVGAVNTSCPVCAVNMTECAGKEPEPEPVREPEPEPEPVEKSGSGGILAVLLLFALVGGGAAYYLKVLKKKPDTKGSADLDDYDYGDDENEEAQDEEDEVGLD